MFKSKKNETNKVVEKPADKVVVKDSKNKCCSSTWTEEPIRDKKRDEKDFFKKSK